MTAAAISGSPGRERLETRVAEAVRRGWVAEYEGADHVVLSKLIPMSLLLNAAAVFLTGGLWLAVVVWRALHPRFHRVILSVDEAGAVVEH